MVLKSQSWFQSMSHLVSKNKSIYEEGEAPVILYLKLRNTTAKFFYQVIDIVVNCIQ